MNINWQDAVTIVAVILVASYNAWKEIRERRVRKAFRLSANPERCGQHETRLAVIESRLKHIEDDILEIKGKLR